LTYRLGDAVLVSWKGKWYTATVIQMGINKLKIHYDGYASSWDEWVDGTRIRYR
jgi:RNA binding activity-knot of a chromodomain